MSDQIALCAASNFDPLDEATCAAVAEAVSAAAWKKLLTSSRVASRIVAMPKACLVHGFRAEQEAFLDADEDMADAAERLRALARVLDAACARILVEASVVVGEPGHDA